MSRTQMVHRYEDIISVENLLLAWREFVRGKRGRKDVQEFELNLMDNILVLHRDLRDKIYTHSKYEAFNISDPKPRNIHKAKVRDRLLHHAVYRILSPFFDRTFIADSYSCRKEKGTHKALSRFEAFAYRVSRNHTKTMWILKCDIRKFFASIHHQRLLQILEMRIPDADILGLLSMILDSFHSGNVGVGLPLGNLTSQLFVNIYMNEFDQYVKHKLKTKYYIRYADDFLFLSEDSAWLTSLVPHIEEFLWNRLRLELHPKKVSIETISSGVDFLGWVHFPKYRVLRTTTKKRMFRRAKECEGNESVVASYLGLLRHGNTRKLQSKISNA